MESIRKFRRYKQNLSQVGEYIVSYTTRVAKINREDGTLERLGWWSQTTSKHINYAASELGLEVVDAIHQ